MNLSQKSEVGSPKLKKQYQNKQTLMNRAPLYHLISIILLEKLISLILYLAGIDVS